WALLLVEFGTTLKTYLKGAPFYNACNRPGFAICLVQVVDFRSIVRLRQRSCCLLGSRLGELLPVPTSGNQIVSRYKYRRQQFQSALDEGSALCRSCGRRHQNSSLPRG